MPVINSCVSVTERLSLPRGFRVLASLCTPPLSVSGIGVSRRSHGIHAAQRLVQILESAQERGGYVCINRRPGCCVPENGELALDS
jgi:hypothetical protein